MSDARRREVAIDIADRIGRAADDGAPLPADIDAALRLAPAVLRRPPTVTIDEVNGFQKPVPFWE